MCLARRFRLALLVVSAALTLNSCASRVRIIGRGTHAPSQALLTATKAELIRKIADLYSSINSFSTTVDLTPSVGSVYEGKIKDYTDLTAYIDFRKPALMRVVGILPVVHTTAFHMVSDEVEFKAHLVVKNRFIEGRNDAPAASPNKLENIRPQTFLSAMLVQPIDTANETVVLSDDTTETNAAYQLETVGKAHDDIFIHRRITFDRVNLQLVEQRELDETGAIVSRTRYADFKIFDNIRFPSHIEITRPKDDYGIILIVTKMSINKPIPDARFVLNRPEGAELQVIGAPVPAKASQ